MSLARRLELLDWAEEVSAWILEDDYDSEYRYDEAPVPALQSLDISERVIYIGSFSKVLFPGLRLGYAVVPEVLINAFTVRRVFMDHHSSVMQPVYSPAILPLGCMAALLNILLSEGRLSGYFSTT